MGKFDRVLLASDFDDTIYNSRLEVSAENVAAIEYFIREGGRFTVSTGRAHRTFSPYVHLAPINAPVILSNGALLYDYSTDQVVCELPLPPQAAEDLAVLSAEMPSIGMETYHGDDVYIHHPNAFTDRHVKRVGTTWTPCGLSDMPTPWSKAVIQDEYPTLLAAQKFLLDRWGDRYEVIFSSSALLEVTAKGATKGGMVLRLAEYLGVERKDVYCVGDNQNDIPMLEKSAIPFAPANCAREVRDWGARVLCPCQEGVIGDIVELLDKLY